MQMVVNDGYATATIYTSNSQPITDSVNDIDDTRDTYPGAPVAVVSPLGNSTVNDLGLPETQRDELRLDSERTAATECIVGGNPERSPATLASQHLITQIHTLASTYWEEPDHQAIDVILAFLGSYFLHERNPLWLHIIGPSSSGKTELGLAPIALPYVDFHKLSDLTANTLMSGLTKGKNSGKQNSLLHRIGMFGLVYMPDFSTFLSKDERLVASVAAQLREIYDGSYDKQTGVEKKEGSDWEGRLSWITAMTPSVERRWMKHNPMGERFSVIRWRAATNHEAVSRKVLQQSMVESGSNYLNADKERNDKISGPRDWIGLLAQRLVSGDKFHGEDPPGIRLATIAEQLATLKCLEETPKPKSPSEELVYQGGLYALAEIVSQLRTIPNRPDGKNIGQPDNDREASGRFQHQLIKVARGWAYLHRREVEAADMELVRRVAGDSIPLSKRPIIDALYAASKSGMWMDIRSLQEEAGYQTQAALVWQLQELLAVKAVITSDDDIQRNWDRWDTEWKLSDQFIELWRKGGLSR